MRLHENAKLFEQAIRATAQRMKIRDIYIEKDYWVTYALYTIFHNAIGRDMVFPAEGEILDSLKIIKERLKTIKWHINLDQ